MEMIDSGDNGQAFNDYCAARSVTPEDIYRMSEERLDELIRDFHNRNNSDPV